MDRFRSSLFQIDWILFGCAFLIAGAGLITINSFTNTSPFFDRQVIWLSIAFLVFVVSSLIDWRFLRRTGVVVSLFGITCGLLGLLFVVGSVFMGAQSWFNFGFAAFQPVDFAKIALIVVLAKYFSRRHIDIAYIRHILVSGFYAFILFALVAIQPDFGSAMILFLIWFGMVFVSGISKKHLLVVFFVATSVFAGLWFFGFQEYQKERIMTFINPLSDIHGAGYNAYQSTIAVGSGEWFGKGIGYGTQSKLRFLPEYQTDFVFAAFAEEWGFIGVCLLIILFCILISRIVSAASVGATNFEILFALGVAIYIVSHFTLHVGINVGLLPVTGTTLPMMSYGGSHLVAEFLALGMVVGMRRFSRGAHKDTYTQEFSGGYDR